MPPVLVKTVQKIPWAPRRLSQAVTTSNITSTSFSKSVTNSREPPFPSQHATLFHSTSSFDTLAARPTGVFLHNSTAPDVQPDHLSTVPIAKIAMVTIFALTFFGIVVISLCLCSHDPLAYWHAQRVRRFPGIQSHAYVGPTGFDGVDELDEASQVVDKLWTRRNAIIALEKGIADYTAFEAAEGLETRPLEEMGRDGLIESELPLMQSGIGKIESTRATGSSPAGNERISHVGRGNNDGGHDEHQIQEQEVAENGRSNLRGMFQKSSNIFHEWRIRPSIFQNFIARLRLPPHSTRDTYPNCPEGRSDNDASTAKCATGYRNQRVITCQIPDLPIPMDSPEAHSSKVFDSPKIAKHPASSTLRPRSSCLSSMSLHEKVTRDGTLVGSCNAFPTLEKFEDSPEVSGKSPCDYSVLNPTAPPRSPTGPLIASEIPSKFREGLLQPSPGIGIDRSGGCGDQHIQIEKNEDTAMRSGLGMLMMCNSSGGDLNGNRAANTEQRVIFVRFAGL